MVTPTKGGALVGDTDVRTPITSSGDNSNPEKDNGNESEVFINPCISIFLVHTMFYCDVLQYNLSGSPFVVQGMSIWAVKHMEHLNGNGEKEQSVELGGLCVGFDGRRWRIVQRSRRGEQVSRGFVSRIEKTGTSNYY